MLYSPSPPNASSPASGGSTPLSFRANVNRAKTKRWVEAKKYSYDGGDWGDEDDEDEEEEQYPAPAAVPRPSYANQRIGSSSELSSRRLSGIVGAENEPRASPTTDSSTGAPPQVAQNAPAVGLPDIKRMSSFGTDFLGGDSTSQSAHIESQEPSLQHNPSQASQASTTSQGFTSVVHQAFDVPETPNSTTGSVARSNSDGTSVISPIMGSRGSYDDRTPTILEEPAESSTPTAGSNNSSPFIPGHRRDMSLPDRDNSPSKQPIITEHDAPSEGQAELSIVTPGQTQLPQESPQQASPDTPGKDFVAPLKFGERKQSEQSGPAGYRGNIPIITTPNVNDSPHDANSDQLREEIMRSLSRENSQEPEETPPTQTENTKPESIPNQYEKYWEGPTGPGLDEAPRTLVSESHHDLTASHPLGSQDSYAALDVSNEPAAVVDEAPQKPRLGRRFSWESSASANEPDTEAPPVSVAPVASQIEDDHAARAPEAVDEQLPSYDSEGSGSQRIEKPRLSIVPPIPESSSPPVQIMGPTDGPNNENNVIDTSAVGTGNVDEQKLQSFRSILNLATPNQRIKAFDNTRDQFATINTGLNRWLQITVHEKPEHAETIQSAQNTSAIPRSSPSRTRFPKLTSLGNLGTPTDGTPTSASHLRRPSGNIGTIMNKSNVEQRGKDLLHTAGTFGGKAGEAAKGLFAKGRSKFRAGGDKGQSSTSRSRSLHFNFSSESNGSQGNSSSRNSINIGSLPVFKFGQNKNASSAQTNANGERNNEPSGKRLKSTGSMDISRLQINSEDTSNRAVSQPLPMFSDQERLRKESARKSGIVGDLEQEMIAALGLSPVKAQPDPPAQAGLALPSNEFAERSPDQTGPPPPSKDEAVPIPTKDSSDNHRLSKEKSLPVLPTQDFGGSSSLEPAGAEIHKPATETTQTAFRSIRPVVEVEPSSPPRTPPKETALEDAPPPTPPKDPAHLKAVKSGKSGHAARQPSVSTLGIEDRKITDEADEEFNNTPPSPIQPPSPEAPKPEPEPEPEPDPKPEPKPVYGKQLPEAQTSTSSLPSAEEITTGFEHIFPPRPATSAQVLDAKRQSISGLPPSTPNFQSPLRNEVRYSPATRSSMLSFGSWGRQSNNSKGTRPPTPANDLSMRVESNSSAQNGESKMEKLKGFGRRRRASVGDLLTGIQGGFQGLQEKIHQPEPQEKEKEKGHQRKRTFNRISSLFTRSDFQPPEDAKVTHRKPMPTTSEGKDLPSRPSADRSWAPTSQNGRQSIGDKDLPEPPSDGFTPAPRLSSEAMPRHRASMDVPPTASPSALASGRFYSSASSGDSLPAAQHTRVKSMPLTTQTSHPLSPIPHSDSDNSGSPRSEGGGLETRLYEDDQRATQNGLSNTPVQHWASQLPADNEYEHQQFTQPSFKPNPDIRSRKLPNAELPTTEHLEPRNIAVSGMSNVTLSEHPHRDETQTLARNSEPVELALRDDSSDEIVMSPTAYPGQEWMPMHC
ncbi:hypothetical protein N7478_001644 [Penicillium angulare]|uniref:uncharacterized protein n=1 Tax=Penicillium angulare TaxID=116970 RepID=UPI0025424492|nr:uncharacterized protein N7478_001644 [Penicillium angulare]KAJ5288614.1 hypothetical protein N7478_001644 [Penicillium angulare]